LADATDAWDETQARARSSSSASSQDTAVRKVQPSSSCEDIAGAEFDSCQSLRFAMLYQPGNSRLQVTVKSFCVLPSNMTAGCFVVVSLLTNCNHDEKLQASVKTSLKQKTKIPEWEETLVLSNVSKPSKDGDTLVRLDVIAFDQFSREICIGRLKVDVATLKDCQSQEFFRTLDEEKETLMQDFGQSSILAGLFYHHSTQTLVIDLIKVKDLANIAAHLCEMADKKESHGHHSNHGKQPIYYVKVRIYDGSSIVKERRSTERRVVDEILNESLTFNLEKKNIRNISAELSIYIKSKKEERQLGWFSIGATSSGSVEKEHWANMLRSHASPVVQWISFSQVPSSTSFMSAE